MPTAAFVRLARGGPIMRQRISEYMRGSICCAASAAALPSARDAQPSERRSTDTSGPLERSRACSSVFERFRAFSMAGNVQFELTAPISTEELMTIPAPQPRPDPDPRPQPDPKPASPDETPVRIIEPPHEL